MSLESNRKTRKLTRFLAQELLYDYASGKLDSLRRHDVEEYMAGCRETQREFEMLKRGMKSAALASHIQVSDGLHEALENFEPQWRKSLSEWTLWSSQRGWKVMPYVFVGVALALVLVIKKPWRAGPSKDFVLAEQMRNEAESAKTDVKNEPSVPAPPSAPATVPVVAAGPGTPPPVTVPATDLPAIKDTASVEEKKPAESAGPTKGFLMRGEIDVSDFGNTWPLIRDKIIALGGRAAGSVELGWLRKQDESYFHLTMPEANYNELELFLGTFGPVRFSKERHPRVMPRGQIRIILTVKDGGATNESPAETP